MADRGTPSSTNGHNGDGSTNNEGNGERGVAHVPRHRCARTGVYIIFNSVSKKCYIGSSTRSVASRLRDHRTALNQNIHCNKHLQNAWNKYGSSSFWMRALEYVPPVRCIVREQFWLDKFRAANPNHGYNISPTAGNTTGYKMPPDVLAKVTENNRRTKSDPVVRAKLSAATKHNWDDPAKRVKMTEANKGRVTTEFKKNRSEYMKAWFANPANRAAHAERMRKRYEKDPTLAQRIVAARKPMTAQHRASIAAALKKPETRAKMSASRRAYFARKKVSDAS